MKWIPAPSLTNREQLRLQDVPNSMINYYFAMISIGIGENVASKWEPFENAIDALLAKARRSS